MSIPSEQRQQELIEFYKSEITEDPYRFEIGEYTSWDDFLEFEEKITYDEWDWCRENLRVEITEKITYDEWDWCRENLRVEITVEVSLKNED